MRQASLTLPARVGQLGQRFFRLWTPIPLALAVVLMMLFGAFTNHLRHGDMLFHTDLARDFLVLDEMVATKKPTLIGPRSGGIPGVFHGPAWYYVNVLPFFIVQGDPVMMGWWWWLMAVLMVIVFVSVLAFFTRSLEVSLLVGIVFAIIWVPSSASPVNNYAADLTSFLIFAVWWQWLQNRRWQWAAAGWLGMGILVQFQMAFVVPLALVWFPVFVGLNWKSGQKWSLLTPLFFVPPLASFILFDVRHEWLQVKSALTYITDGESTARQLRWWTERWWSATGDGLFIFGFQRWWSMLVIILMGGRAWINQHQETQSAWKLLSFWYASWWLVTLAFSGTIWTYYFSPFWGMMLFCIGLIAARDRYSRYLLWLAVVVMLVANWPHYRYHAERYNNSSWRLLQLIAADALSVPDRGYFLYSQDQFTYSLKYAFGYYQRLHPETNAFPFQKKTDTVVVKAVDDPRNPHMTAEAWQYQRIYLDQAPVSIVEYPFGYRLEHYQLDEAATQIPIDPHVILDLHFR